MSFLGEHAPEIVQKLGLDVSELGKDAEYAGKLAVVTFREPHDESGGRRDPVADLPPSYSRYGILDRDHRDRVEPGQTWIAQPYSPTGSSAVFLVPIQEVDLASLLALDKDKVQELARELVENRPDLVDALRDLLPTQAEPRADPEEVARLRQALSEAGEALGKAAVALGKARSSALGVLEEAADDVAQAAGVLSRVPRPAAEPQEPKLVRKKRRSGPLPMYVADANLFINAERWKWEDCQRVIEAAGQRLRLATTRQVYEELKHSYRLPEELTILEVNDIDERLFDLAEANESATGKKASENDLSLIQALLDNEEIRGIITEDPDVLNIHPSSLVMKLDGRDVECLQAAEFCARHKKLVKV